MLTQKPAYKVSVASVGLPDLKKQFHDTPRARYAAHPRLAHVGLPDLKKVQDGFIP